MIESPIYPLRAETAKSRSNLYRLFSALYLREVSPDVLKTLKSREVSAVFEELDSDIVRLVSNAKEEDLLNDLAEEYAALFIVPGGIPPYESVRLEGQLYQKSALEVEEFYKKCGLLIRDDFTLFPDHIGMEFEFMGYLADKEAGSLINNTGDEAEKWLELQMEFFEGHISRWTFKFLQDMEKCAFHPFYKGLAELTQRFLETEKEFFMEIANN